MKNITRIVAALLLVSLVFVLVSCGSYSTIKSNFKDAGYTEVKSEDSDEKDATLVLAELEDGNITCTVHVFKKEGALLNRFATVLEFNSKADLEKAVGESATLKGIVKDAQKSKYVRDNCVLIPSILDNDEKVAAFNK